ncbi:hypothetical protein DL93DRAFT_2231710 [Clavulina sp. PMI_390]|nr:hypothetical protein DL93DRAFT_2231710 [Clavulina sp. PMI_390]
MHRTCKVGTRSTLHICFRFQGIYSSPSVLKPSSTTCFSAFPSSSLPYSLMPASPSPLSPALEARSTPVLTGTVAPSDISFFDSVKDIIEQVLGARHSLKREYMGSNDDNGLSTMPITKAWALVHEHSELRALNVGLLLHEMPISNSGDD